MARSPLAIRRAGPVAILTLDRPEKRNAINDALIAAIGAFFARPPAGAKA
ncbi:MAG: enoyl-CoA hydratase, partial [Rhodospirillales bacterium]|nr:enoyl-CoA hydratase [Rhodospirillales bacterium]